MKKDLIISSPHRRYNPLKDEWVLVSPQRTRRPWNGEIENKMPISSVKYDPKCYLCPGNVRANGESNPQYKDTFVFTNDFPAMMNTSGRLKQYTSGILSSETISGECRVVCFSKRHDLTFAQMETADIKRVIETWIEQIKDLKKQYNYVQIFENKGEMMGCSNSHPHGQIWASSFIPDEVEKENRQQKQYFEKNKSGLLPDYLKAELSEKERIIIQNESWAVLVPFWAVWPFETLLLPKKRNPQLFMLTQKEILSLAEIMKQILQIYDRLFTTSMPYSMGWHFAPLNQSNPESWQLHAHYYPPLLRSATVKKFMVGYEMLAEAQRDITPEIAAERLRSLL